MILIPEKKNQPVLDFMDANDRAYQITVGETHDISIPQLQNIVTKLGVTQQNPLSLYFLVPEHRFKAFKWNYTGKFKGLDPRVSALEGKNADVLKDELKTIFKNGNKKITPINTMGKEEVIKNLLKKKSIDAKTTQEMLGDIKKLVKVCKICIPKDPPKEIVDIIDEISKMK